MKSLVLAAGTIALQLILTASVWGQQDYPTEDRYYENTEPPRASGRLEIPGCGRIRPTGSDQTLGAAARNLSRILRNAGHTQVGWFLTHPVLPPSKIIPDSTQINGFAVVTHLQPSNQSGSIFSGAPPRQDRLFAFFIVRGALGRRLSDAMSYMEAGDWYRNGAAIPFTRLDSIRWTNEVCVAFVYVFERSGPSGAFNPKWNIDTQTQFKGANLWQVLGLQ